MTSSSRVPSPFRDGETSEKHGGVLSSAKEAGRKPGGWKAMPFVLGLSLYLFPFSHFNRERNLYNTKSSPAYTKNITTRFKK